MDRTKVGLFGASTRSLLPALVGLGLLACASSRGGGRELRDEELEQALACQNLRECLSLFDELGFEYSKSEFTDYQYIIPLEFGQGWHELRARPDFEKLMLYIGESEKAIREHMAHWHVVWLVFDRGGRRVIGESYAKHAPGSTTHLDRELQQRLWIGMTRDEFHETMIGLGLEISKWEGEAADRMVNRQMRSKISRDQFASGTQANADVWPADGSWHQYSVLALFSADGLLIRFEISTGVVLPDIGGW